MFSFLTVKEIFKFVYKIVIFYSFNTFSVSYWWSVTGLFQKHVALCLIVISIFESQSEKKTFLPFFHFLSNERKDIHTLLMASEIITNFVYVKEHMKNILHLLFISLNNILLRSVKTQRKFLASKYKKQYDISEEQNRSSNAIVLETSIVYQDACPHTSSSA